MYLLEIMFQLKKFNIVKSIRGTNGGYNLIKDNVNILDGCVIGKKGFGFFLTMINVLEYPHIGNVIIGKDCEIGANCVIDRGSIKNTVIDDRTFLDNLVHIAHNVTIGKDCLIGRSSWYCRTSNNW